MPENTTPLSSPTNETWKPIPGYEGYYEASDLGRVRRVKASSGTRANRLLKPQMRGTGYYTVMLYREKRGRCFHVHSLVAAAFIGKRPKACEVNHKDGVKTNNQLSNLEYVTSSRNTQHAVDMGLLTVSEERRARGERQGLSKLTEQDISEIRRLIESGQSLNSIGVKFGVSRQTIFHIKRGRTWRHV